MAVRKRVRELLKQCCIREGGCTDQGLHACDRASPLAWEEVDEAGVLESKGPLAPEVQAAIEDVTGSAVTRNNRVSLLVDGTQSYSAMLDLVEAAQQEILFENFILRADAVGTAFTDVLRGRAEEGVEVRVLHDPFGSLMSRRTPIGFRFHHSPASVRVYNPPRPTMAFLRSGRDHRKLVVEDRRRVVTGGLGLADVWSGNCVTHCTWRDSAVLVEGEAAGAAAVEFDKMWKRGVSFTPRASQSTRSSRTLLEPLNDLGDVPVRVIADGPRERRVESVLLRVFEAARSEILITNPYFIPPVPLSESLASAAGRGVDVQILIPRSNNHKVAGLTIEHVLRPLLTAGVRIWRWEGPLIHAKTVVVDRCWSLIGSSNLDPLSLRKNNELNLEIHGPRLGHQMEELFAHDRKRSTSFTLDEWRARSRVRRWAGRLSALASAWQ